MFAGPMNPEAALIVKSLDKNVSANVKDDAWSQKIDIFAFFLVDS